MIGSAVKKLMQKYGTRISDSDRAAGMNARMKTGESAGKAATSARKSRLKKSNKKSAILGGSAVALGAVYAASEKIETKDQAENWFRKNAPDATEAERREFSKKYFGVEY